MCTRGQPPGCLPGLRIGHVSMGRVCALCSRAAGLPRWWAWILLLCAWGRAARRENPDALCMRPWCVLYRQDLVARGPHGFRRVRPCVLPLYFIHS